MKQKHSRETTPLWVWFTLTLIAILIITYVNSYLMVEELIALKK